MEAGDQGSDAATVTRIALLEDDPIIADLLKMTLDQAGWRYRHFTTIAAIRQALETERFDLFILDWSLPDGKADAVIRLVRERLGRRQPILIESVSDDEELIVNALHLGADDYVVKPLRMSEVQARIMALLRRVRHGEPDSRTLGAFRVDETNRRIYRDEVVLKLTAMEFELARFLFAHQNELLTRETLLSEVWGRNPSVDTRTVDAHVSRLRRKLDLGSNTGYQIGSLRGYGYRLERLR